jgi:tetratricopeptide (TPR) repeat protein
MSSEEKKIGLKVAYGYFQEGKWDRALEEYRKLERQDPLDPNLRNMMAEIQARRGAPQEALREYLECARLQAQAGQHDKALATCRRALRLEPGNAGALELQNASIHARLAEAQALLDKGSLDAAHEAGQHLLDVVPTDLDVHKLLDEVQAARLRQESTAASVAVLPEDGPAEAAAADPGREFVAKLFSLAESYLQAEDFDNAIESLVTILKFSPDEPAVRNRLQEVRDQLEKKRQAEEQWAQLQAEEARRLEEAKRQQLEAEARSRWEREEAEARSRMESELSALQKSSASEQDIIQRAAMEMRHKLMGGSDALLPQAGSSPEPPPAPAPPPAPKAAPAPALAPAAAPAPAGSLAADEEARKLKEQRQAEDAHQAEDARRAEQQRKAEEERLARAAEAEAEREAAREAARQATLREAEALRQRFEKEALEREARYKAESEALREQVRREREEAEAAIREREAQMAQEAEMLRRQIEVARLEAEAKAREAAAQEMARRIEEEQRDNEARLNREREDMLRREKEFEERMQSMMREQAARLETEVRAKALADMKAQMEAEAKARAEAEQAALKREQEAMAALKAQQEAQRKAEAEARAKADAERQALDALRQAQELRKQAIIAQALQRTPPAASPALHPAGDAAKPSRRISDALKASATKNIENDHAALLSSARAFLAQDLLQDAMRACQKVLEVDPENSEVKELLKEIFRKRGL